MALVVSLLAVFGTSSAIPLEPRIVNGIPIEASAYPWMVSLRGEVNFTAFTAAAAFNITTLNLTFCGGSLIQLSPPVVLTAAHCVDDVIEDDAGNLYIENLSYPLTFYVDINRTYPDHQVMGDSYQTLRVSSASMIHIHERYWWNDVATDDVPYDGDIALIVFDDDDSLDFSEDDLPSLDSAQLDDEVACCDDGETLKAIGYGRNSSDGTSTETLEYTELTFMTSDDCEAVIRDGNWVFTKPDFSFGGERFICVLGDDTDVCYGDSGGPLFTVDGDDPTIHGVASYILNGCNSGDPSVYISVGHYIDWIDGTINDAVYSISPSPTADTTVSPTTDPTTSPTADPTVSPSVDPTASPIWTIIASYDSIEENAAMGLISHNAVYTALLAAAVLNF